MTMLLENRTISMILTVPEVKELIATHSHSVENLHGKSLSTPEIHKPPSIPIYHGSIIRIEQRPEDEATSDLIVRVPNYHHAPPSTVTISTYGPNAELPGVGENRRPASFKRRAPICPLRASSENRSPPSEHQQTETNTRATNAKRLATRIQHLSQALTYNCKPKRPVDINQIAIIPALPDVEIITDDIQLSPTVKKITKDHSRTSNFITPTILSIKRKCLRIRKRQPAANVTDTQTDSEDNTVESKPADHHEGKRAPLHILAEPSTPTIPRILIDSDSSSIHRYSTLYPQDTTVERGALDIAPPTAITLTDRIHSSTSSQNDPSAHDDDKNMDETLYVVHPNGDTYSECYEVTYQFDPEFQQFLDQKQAEVYLSDVEDGHEGHNSTSPVTSWIPTFPDVRSNSTEAISLHPTTDASPARDEQVPIDQPQSTLSELDQLASLNEDYTIIIELLKNVLQLNTAINAADDDELDPIPETD